jgi:hypothetical protein
MIRSITTIVVLATFQSWADEASIRARYEIKQAASGIIYLNGGAADGLAEGMHLTVFHLTPGDALINRREIGTLTVTATASNSAACEAAPGAGAIQAGDFAELSDADVEIIRITRTSKSRRKYAQVVSFTDGDPVEAELRQYVPQPPLPEVNRVRGRIGFEQSAIIDHTNGFQTWQEGLVLRADMTRIGGSFWNFSGYWRGRLNSTANPYAPTTLNDLLSRTYHIELTYANPTKPYVAGFGRLLLPWAPSLDTIDGGYFARHFGKHVTAGVFAGSTPDPTAWNYNPNREELGTFVSLEAGSYEGIRYMGTAGAAIARHKWHPERNFLFFENNFLVRNRISIYHSLEADQLSPQLVSDGNTQPRIARSFLTLRIQATSRLTFDVNNNYFRGIPTFEESLIGTGLLDKLLFQGWSGGVRLELPYHATVYTNFGADKRENDSRMALNYMGGVVLSHIPRFPFRTDIRYSRFNSSFATGSYASISFSRQVGENLRVEFIGGQQDLVSAYTSQGQSLYLNANVDYLLGRHYVIGSGWSLYRGHVQNYDQYFVNLGYRF